MTFAELDRAMDEYRRTHRRKPERIVMTTAGVEAYRALAGPGTRESFSVDWDALDALQQTCGAVPIVEGELPEGVEWRLEP